MVEDKKLLVTLFLSLSLDHRNNAPMSTMSYRSELLELRPADSSEFGYPIWNTATRNVNLTINIIALSFRHKGAYLQIRFLYLSNTFVGFSSLSRDFEIM